MEAVAQLKRRQAELSPDVPVARNEAKQLAGKLYGKVAVIYGAGFLSGTARRFKGQLNENSKSWAFSDLLPELDHNSVVGYRFPEGASAKQAQVVMLRSPLLHRRTLLRYQVTAELLAKSGGKALFVDALGDSPLAQMMDVITVGDFTSYYLAMLNGVDPSPVDAIDFLKKRLAERR